MWKLKSKRYLFTLKIKSYNLYDIKYFSWHDKMIKFYKLYYKTKWFKGKKNSKQNMFFTDKG